MGAAAPRTPGGPGGAAAPTAPLAGGAKVGVKERALAERSEPDGVRATAPPTAPPPRPPNADGKPPKPVPKAEVMEVLMVVAAG